MPAWSDWPGQPVCVGIFRFCGNKMEDEEGKRTKNKPPGRAFFYAKGAVMRKAEEKKDALGKKLHKVRGMNL
jgi:hypothetical protein